MSSFKVPIKVLNILESIRRKFNGIEENERKLALISWDTILASKKYGGFGVSSFFAMNRALLSKWVWRFLSQRSSMWTRTIKDIHGEKGNLGAHGNITRRSPWLDIVREINVIRSKGLGHKTKKGWIKELCTKNGVKFVSLQETKMEHIELVTINKLWGNSSYDYVFSSSLEPTEKRTLWDYLLRLINRWDGECVIMGDFNEVRSEHERRKYEVILNDISILLKELHDIISMDLEEIAQKAKVYWAIEGDENFKYFHGILNNKRSHLAIRGILVNGDWFVKPNDVKNEFLNHFSSQFDRPASHRICLADVIVSFRWSNKMILNELFLSKKSKERCGIVAQINPLVPMVSHLNSSENIENSLRTIFQLMSRSSSLQVGGRMERINSWDDVVSKVTSRLSKWNSKRSPYERRSDFFYHVPPLQLLSGIRFTHFLYVSCVIWKKVLRWWDLDENMIDSYDDWLLLLKNIRLPKRLKDLFECVCYVKWWLIWRIKNQVLFGDKHPPGDTLFDDLVTISFQWCSNRCNSKLNRSIWLDILKEVVILKNKGIDLMTYCRKKVGNGADTIFWDEVWIREQPLKIQFPRMYALKLRKNMSIADKMSYANIADTFCRLPMGGEESEQYIDICNRLEMVQLSQMHDRWFWSLVGT
nr:RNA-directed DNA polymerase, eukaryota, reverse transcriptase zinc-binding domain protein [Tanacetum cinerariifolium]